MLHKERVFSVGDVQLNELVEKLTKYTSWTLCTGFRCQGYLCLCA